MNITECTAFKASVTDAASKVYFSLAVIINILIKRLIYWWTTRMWEQLKVWNK
jgi:hypothetical protein